jgi:non-ribosomal peptide synthetase component E (peptide arylation enzyme)
MSFTVYKALTDAAKNWPSAPAIHDEYGTLTFQQLLAEAEDLKKILLRSGIKKGMCIGVMARILSAVFLQLLEQALLQCPCRIN